MAPLQLWIGNGRGTDRWSTGASEVFIKDLSARGHPNFSLNCRVGDDEQPMDRAMIDTGSEWSVVGGDLAESLLEGELPCEITGNDINMETVRFGLIRGTLVRVRLSLISLADYGTDLPVDATVLASTNWRGERVPEIVLGFHGFLDRVRFAIDPGSHASRQALFYFGPSS